MPLTTTNMALKAWNNINDFFVHTDLLANWQAIDLHDHSTGKGVQIPTGGIANLAITTPLLRDGAVTDAKMASPNNGVYWTVSRAHSGISSAMSVPGTYVMTTDGSALNTVVRVDSPLVHITLADYTVAGMTPKLRLKAAYTPSADAYDPATTLTLALRPVHLAGDPVVYNGSLSAVTGSSLVVTTAGATAPSHTLLTIGSDFDVPANGLYLISVTNTVGVSNTGNAKLYVTLQAHNV